MAKGKISQKTIKTYKRNVKKKWKKNRNNGLKVLWYLHHLIFFNDWIIYFQIYVHFSYVEKMKEDNCKCSEDWKRKWVKYGPLIQFSIMFALGIVQILLFMIFNFKLHENIKRCISLIFYLIIYVLYIYNLMKIDCQCSENWRRTFILIISSFGIFTQVITLLYHK